jgi:transposase-like protein
MPWKETATIEQKVEFICEWLSEKYSISELCRFFEITRPTAYKLISHYEQYGIKRL